MTWALIDVSWMAHRARFALDGLSYEEMPTGVVYGFFEQLRAVCRDRHLLTNQVLMFMDSRKSIRRLHCPTYKLKRQENRTPEELAQLAVMHKQVSLLQKEILPEVGFPVYLQTGLESDDLIASAAQQLSGYEQSGRNGVIVTADGDLFQCITDNIHWYDPARDLYLDEPGLRLHKGATPDLWWRVKALAGCHSDNVRGIPGVGESSAIKYLLKLLPVTYKRYKDIESPEGQQVFEYNCGLVRLPHARTRPVVLRSPEYNPAAFFKWCKRLGLDSYLEGTRRREWDAFFAGQFTAGLQIPRRRGERRA